jgi:60 kDa SS-A/Ro ribonucleoprotein
MATYAQHARTRGALDPQTEQASPLQVQNSAGGYSFPVDHWTRAERFLILGNEGGSYYATERKLTKDAASSLLKCADEDIDRLADLIHSISVQGRAYKVDPVIFALALLSDREPVLRKLCDVLRTGGHLLQFAGQVKGFRGWGRMLRRAVASWYEAKAPNELAYQVTKYRQRGGVTHRDVLRMAHPRDYSDGHRRVYDFITTSNQKWETVQPHPTITNEDSLEFQRTVTGKDGAKTVIQKIVVNPAHPSFDLPSNTIQGFTRLQSATTPQEAASLIREYSGALVREHVPTRLLDSPDVWDALLDRMPMTAMIRNLGKMSAVGLLRPLSAAADKVVAALSDFDRSRRARIHPVQVLVAAKIYAQGRGDKGSLTWTPVQPVCDALDRLYYQTFENVEPTGKRILLAVDVSGSMSMGKCAGASCLTAAEGAAAMAMTIARRERNYHIMGFADSFRDLGINASDTLSSILHKTRHQAFGSTDCALAIGYAMQRGLSVDAFVILTDSETYAGKDGHVHQVLAQYRQKSGIPAKLVVVGMVGNDFTIADPNDAGSMDVIGFDTSAPRAIADFIRGGPGAETQAAGSTDGEE